MSGYKGTLMEDLQGAEEVLSEDLPENVPEMKVESRDEMLSRHRKEIQQLQNKETELKKAAAKGSKAEQKTKKKQVEEQILKLSAELKEQQAEQLASLGYADGNGTAKGNLDNLVKAIAGVSVSSQLETSKNSKSVKRREKRALQDAAREQRIQEEQQSIVNDRVIENEKLENKLEPLGLTVNEIKPDGHCLYRAVEDQLARVSGDPSPYTYLDLRKLVSSYMREHAPDFIPFFLSETDIEGDSVAERFESYCREIETTAAWGGQLELQALSRCLKRHIMIYSGSFPDVEMGKEYKKSSDGPEQDSLYPSIKLSYHQHAYGLGEHYNSVVPA